MSHDSVCAQIWRNSEKRIWIKQWALGTKYCFMGNLDIFPCSICLICIIMSPWLANPQGRKEWQTWKTGNKKIENEFANVPDKCVRDKADRCEVLCLNWSSRMVEHSRDLTLQGVSRKTKSPLSDINVIVNKPTMYCFYFLVICTIQQHENYRIKQMWQERSEPWTSPLYYQVCWFLLNTSIF